MTMTAREAMQALLDGKGVISDQDHLYWLTEQDRLVFRRVHGFVESDSSELNQIVSLYGESPDYPLTYAQAWEAMLDGKIVMCKANERYAFRFRDGVLEHSCQDDEFTMWEEGVLLMNLQESKWKVIE